MDPPGRVVALVVVDATGRGVGVLPAFEVETPWWEDAGPVVDAVHERHGVEVVVLRLLATERPEAPGGAVAYAVEVAGDASGLPLAPVPDGLRAALNDHPLRCSWARPGGWRDDLAWADAALGRRGTPRAGPAEQVRAWNLSSLWRLPLARRAAWLKVVPPFFAHEGAVLERLDGARVPRLLAREGPRLLLAEVPGDDLHGADVSLLPEMVDLLVDLQRAWVGRADELRALGAFDWRPPALEPAVADVVARTAPEIDAEDARALDALVRDLPARARRIASCGVPDTLVHGDFHPGNVRGRVGSMTLLDWGDCGVGHPLFDRAAFLGRVEPAAAASTRRRWDAAWEAAVPGCDPARADALLAPVAAARQAVVYRGFLDRIEPSEQPYHRRDPARWLRRAAALFREE